MIFLKTNIQNACGNDDLRPHLKCVYFKNGYAYASDCHILIRESLKDIHLFDEEQIRMLDDKLISSDSFKYLKNITSFQVKENGILVRQKSGLEILVIYSKEEKRIDFEKVIPDINNCTFDHKDLVLALNPYVLKKLLSCLESTLSKIYVMPNEKNNRAILLGVDDISLEKRLMLLMPLSQ